MQNLALGKTLEWVFLTLASHKPGCACIRLNRLHTSETFFYQAYYVALAGLKTHNIDQTGLKLSGILPPLPLEC